MVLSLVDSGTGNGPLSLRSEGSGGMYKKRYNVATSRAKDQLWVVHSLDVTRDLKPGDLRRRLIEYAANPEAAEQKLGEITAKSDSPFEEEVARTLVGRDFSITQQYEVGAYRIDMAALTPQKKIAIECDGERWHSGAEKIREDLERQTILERLGWSFIRIRGSEYYRDKAGTMERVIRRLEDLGATPETTQRSGAAPSPQSSRLLNEILAASRHYLETGTTEMSPEERAAAMAYALDSGDPQSEEATDAGEAPTAPGCTRIDNAPGRPEANGPAESSEDEQSPSETPEGESSEGAQPTAATQVQGDAGRRADEETADLADADLLRSIWVDLSNERPDEAEELERPHGNPATAESGSSAAGGDWLVAELTARSLEFKDMRGRGGCLWVKGGKALKSSMAGLKDMGATFQFKASGCRAFKGEPAWWLSGYPTRTR